MSRELWLLRHAKAERDTQTDDFDRPLKKRGKRAAEKLGAWLEEQQLLPDVMISSPAKRAYATAKIVRDASGLGELTIHQDTRVYFQGVTQLLLVLAECAGRFNRVLLVGHNPDLEELLVYLVAEQLSGVSKLLPTATLARITLPDDWTKLDAGSGQLLSVIYAKSLPEADKE